MDEPIDVLLVDLPASYAGPVLDGLARRGFDARSTLVGVGEAAVRLQQSDGRAVIVEPVPSAPQAAPLFPIRLWCRLEAPPAGVTFLDAASPAEPLAFDTLVARVADRLRLLEADRELSRLRMEVAVRARQQEVLSEFGVTALSAVDITDLLEHGLDLLRRSFEVPLAAVFEAEPGSQGLVLRAGQGWKPGVVGRRVPAGYDELAGRALDGTASMPARLPGGTVPLAPLLRDHGVRSGLAVLLPGPHGPRGVLGVYTGTARRFDRGDVLFVQGVANILAAAISRRASEEHLLQSQARLQGVQKMEAIGRLAGGIAHDFNNLVQAIGGYTDLMLKRLPSHDPLQHHAVEIKRAGDRAAALTRQLLAFARQQVLQPRLLDLNDSVCRVEQLLRRLIGEDILLETELDERLGTVKADATQVEQVLMNLAVNARDAMPDGGTLTIETRNVELSAQDQRDVFAIVPGPYALLAVTDTGCGMSAETRARAFDPFFTTKPPGQGTGLGLSTVYGIVKQSGGYIWVDSEPGQGTRVRIYLPRLATPAEAGRAVAGSAPAPAATRRGYETLLLVEDEEGVRDLVAEWLVEHGYSVLAAANGADALALAAAHPGAIHLMIADVVMPQMGGPALASRLLPLRPGMKVIFVSGHAEEAIGDPHLLAAGTAFLQKPFSLEALLRQVRATLDAGHAQRDERARAPEVPHG
jgi:signal transduction histidine kinase/ActR/RegA family two-component response regulator